VVLVSFETFLGIVFLTQILLTPAQVTMIVVVDFLVLEEDAFTTTVLVPHILMEISRIGAIQVLGMILGLVTSKANVAMTVVLALAIVPVDK